jgi:hypothetical protein
MQQGWWEAAYTKWVKPQVLTVINDYEDPSYHSRLPAAPTSGLAEVFHPEYEIPTAAALCLPSRQRGLGLGVGQRGADQLGEPGQPRLCARRQERLAGGRHDDDTPQPSPDADGRTA